MNWKKIGKVTFITLGSLILILAIVGSSVYYFYYGKYPVDGDKHPHNVEYIDPEKARLNQNFNACDEERIAQYYNPERATYSKGKNGLRTFILENYQNKDYSDSGYLNIRFIINCDGKAGRYIIHENNLNLEPKKFDTDLVEQLFKLTSELTEWNPVFHREKSWDSYMYLSYRIEHGEIIEILP